MKQESAFKTLLKVMSNFFIKIPNTFDKDFIKERRHLHFGLSFIIMFALFVFAHFFMQFEYAPVWVAIIFGWLGAYIINFLREVYREDKHGYRFDFLDIFAGAWGGIFASLIYLLIF